MKAIDIINTLEEWIKPSLIDEWDNTGFQVGNSNVKIKKILVALDVDRKVLDRAIDGGYNMIISHHPLIFKKLSEIRKDDYKGDLLLDIIKKDIVIYNAHSNLDLVKGGVNDVLAKKLKMKDLKDLNIVYRDEEYDYGYGRVGNIKKIKVREYLDYIKKALDVNHLIVYGDIDRMVDRVAVCGGSGSNFIGDAYKQGAQLYLTGDIKYHEAQYGNELGMVIVDAGHYDSEKLVLEKIKSYLDLKLEDDIKIDVLDCPTLPRLVY